MKTFFIALLSGLMGALIFTAANNYLYVRPIAVVKVDKILTAHIERYAVLELTPEQQQDVSRRFADALEAVMREVEDEQRVTLLTAPAVVSDVSDYTSYISLEIQRRMDESKY